jgi:hypothetical protein
MSSFWCIVGYYKQYCDGHAPIYYVGMFNDDGDPVVTPYWEKAAWYPSFSHAREVLKDLPYNCWYIEERSN